MVATSEVVLRCVGLVRRFGDRTAVDNVSFEIYRGETYGLLGPNGSGKTTTISLLAGILSADAGSVELAGEPITTSSTTAKAAIGLVPQEIALYQDLSPVENLRFFGRQSGVLRRTLASPASPTAVVLGIGAGWLLLALILAAIIVSVGALAFGVDWGHPGGAVLLTLLFCLVGTGAGLLVGSALTSEDTATAITVPAGLVLAALGGCMVPSEVFPDFVLTVSKATPHYWALEGWKELMFDGAGLTDIASQLVVLTGFAVASVAASAVVLRRSLLG